MNDLRAAWISVRTRVRVSNRVTLRFLACLKKKKNLKKSNDCRIITKVGVD